MPSNPYQGRRSALSGVRHGGGTLQGNKGAELARQSTRTDLNKAEAQKAAFSKASGSSGMPDGAMGFIDALSNAMQRLRDPDTYATLFTEGLGFRPDWFEGLLVSLGFKRAQDADNEGEFSPEAVPAPATA